MELAACADPRRATGTGSTGLSLRDRARCVQVWSEAESALVSLGGAARGTFVPGDEHKDADMFLLCLGSLISATLLEKTLEKASPRLQSRQSACKRTQLAYPHRSKMGRCFSCCWWDWLHCWFCSVMGCTGS